MRFRCRNYKYRGLPIVATGRDEKKEEVFAHEEKITSTRCLYTRDNVTSG